MLVVKSFTEIANRITPKILRMILIPEAPKIDSIFFEDFKMA
jgi:hypothetical protein